MMPDDKVLCPTCCYSLGGSRPGWVYTGAGAGWHRCSRCKGTGQIDKPENYPAGLEEFLERVWKASYELRALFKFSERQAKVIERARYNITQATTHAFATLEILAPFFVLDELKPRQSSASEPRNMAEFMDRLTELASEFDLLDNFAHTKGCPGDDSKVELHMAYIHTRGAKEYFAKMWEATRPI